MGGLRHLKERSMKDEGPHQLWLFRPKPLEDELLSSWLVRCAYANARKLHAFCSSTWGTRHHFWERDLDRSADVRLLTVLADSTNTPRRRTYLTSLAAYEGVLFESFTLNGELPFVLPIGKRGRNRLGYGMQFCPVCLASDEKPYYRRIWRVSCLVVCPTHRCFLHDCCPQCDSPITFHQGDYRERVLSFRSSITICSNCGLDRRIVQALPCSDDARGNRLMVLQSIINDAILTEWAQLPGCSEQRIMSLPYFQGLHDLLRALCSRSRTGQLRDGCAVGIDEQDYRASSSLVGVFDRLRFNERVLVLEMAAWLFECWPERFVSIARKGSLASSYFINYKSPTAYWFYSVVNEHLNNSHYHPSKQETDACAAFLKDSGLLVSKNNIQRWLGRYYVDKSRYK